MLAVLNELSQRDESLSAMFVCDRAFETQSRGLMAKALVPVEVKVIAAGKLRRYHNVPFWKQLLDLPTVFFNLRDLFKIAYGYLQSLILIRRFKPDVVFAKGGYVCLPLGYAARTLGVPVVVHDSDTRPGLTNKVLSRFAVKIATGSPLENYNYPAEKARFTGVPIDAAFHRFSPEEQVSAKQALGFAPETPLLVVTGGGLGAASINEGVLQAAPKLLEQGYGIYHVTGKRHFAQISERAVQHERYKLVEFVYQDMPRVLGAADVVVSRASATFLQEMAALAKATIMVPASQLGDQVKNAEVYRKADAAVVLYDDQIRDGHSLEEAVERILKETDKTHDMIQRFHAFSAENAAKDVADMVYEVGSRG